MKASKGRMKSWLVTNKKNVSYITKIEASLVSMDNRAAMSGWLEDLSKERLELLSKLWLNIRNDKKLWRQKSRVKWLKEGDKNSKFFHFVANGRRKSNRISDILIDGVKVSEPVQVKCGVLISLRIISRMFPGLALGFKAWISGAFRLWKGSLLRPNSLERKFGPLFVTAMETKRRVPAV
ncbi:hypothetical protein Ddye_005717 [Dipteronia dyeriana]|uniref:Uncharacterized protein n=1 Tax=Dipteronia dyeriana TaxID=168575 RepID=A0AAE0CPZ9_9ROSI|nr:hypothetical protein Ddye_005717 [Dipteronia dyeriana]